MPYPDHRLIDPRSVLLGPGNPKSLENVNTNVYPDGSMCFVLDQRCLYVLDKSSTAVVSPPDVVAATTGRWKRYSDPNGIKVYNTIAELRTALTSGVSAAVYYVRWHTTRLGGGGGYFLGGPIGVLVDDNGYIITGGTLAATRVIESDEAIDARWWGALCQGTNESAMVQSAIAVSGALSRSIVYIPPGLLLGTGINATYGNTSPGLTLRSMSRESVVRVATAGHVAIDFTGNGGCTIEDMNLQCIGGDVPNAPSAYVLFARNATNGSAGHHTLRNVRLTGACTIGMVVSLSSEVNTYENAILDNRTPDTTTIFVHDQNYAGIASDYATFPVTFAGGNTVHNFYHCQITAPGGNGIGMSISGALNITLLSPHLNGAGAAGVKFEYANSQSFVVLGGSDELSTTHGFMVGAGRTLDGMSFTGYYSYGDIFGEDTSLVEHLSVLASTFVPGCSLYDLKVGTVWTNTNGNPVVVRHKEEAVNYLNISFGNHTAPALSYGVNSNQIIPCADAKTRYYQEQGISTLDRLKTHSLFGKVNNMPTYPAAYTANWVPNTDNGSIQVMTLTGDVTINAIGTGDLNMGVASEPNSVSITFIFVQDVTGGHAMNFGASFKTNWVPNTASGKINLIEFRYVVSIGAWIQMGSAVGL